MTKPLKNKIALITGCSTGLGKEIALKYAELGAHIILVARNETLLIHLSEQIEKFGGTSTIANFDLTEFEKIDALGSVINERFGKLDILVGNAAIATSLTPTHQITPKDWQKVIDTNLTANARIIRSFHPLLKKAENPRAIFVTCDVTKNPENFFGAYSASKAGLENLVKIYAQENKQSNLKVNLVSFEKAATALRRKFMPGEDKNEITDPSELTDIFVKLVDKELEDTGRIFTI